MPPELGELARTPCSTGPKLICHTHARRGLSRLLAAALASTCHTRQVQPPPTHLGTCFAERMESRFRLVTLTPHLLHAHCHTHRRHPQAFLMRKLKIAGAMSLAMKLQPILDAAQPKAKL